MAEPAIRFRFRAPWCRDLVATSLAVAVTCGAIATVMFFSGNAAAAGLTAAFSLVPLVLSIRGYEIEHGTLSIVRLLWRTRVPLGARPTASIRPGLLAGSSRVDVSQSLFSYSGRFFNSELGHYRAFATNLERTVALSTADGTIVVSPDDPIRFIMALDLLHLRDDARTRRADLWDLVSEVFPDCQQR